MILWGLLGPETLASERRTRTLRLGATVRTFNDLAVPGLGGVWFGKQLLLALLGVAIAERIRQSGKRAQNIEVANAVEALACWLALDSSGWESDPRLRGARKLFGRQDLSFATVSKRRFYVTQPMRQATVQPLRALGLVEANSERFSAFRLTDHGAAFIDAAWASFKPHKRSVLEHLVLWATGVHDDVKNSGELKRALSPLAPMSDNAREFLRERIVQGDNTGASRRRRALDWVESLRQRRRPIAWTEKPPMVDELHWRDLRAGALFFTARDAAIALLDEIESYVGNSADRRMCLDAALPATVVEKLRSLRGHAQTFLDDGYDPSPAKDATAFCGECAEEVDVRVLEKLLLREGLVLRQRGREIVPGLAFRGDPAKGADSTRSPEEEGTEVEIGEVVPLPEGISRRVHNLFYMNLDMQCQLGEWLTQPQ
ncbi:MAG: S49 family peptidase [Bryobacteraceae bacterium]|nr:S49 family peptidase [Bryobacteraceae bacterium]